MNPRPPIIALATSWGSYVVGSYDPVIHKTISRIRFVLHDNHEREKHDDALTYVYEIAYVDDPTRHQEPYCIIKPDDVKAVYSEIRE